MVAAISAWRRTCGSWRSKRGPYVSGGAPQAPAAEIREDLTRRVVPGRTGDAAARMRAGTAHVQPAERTAVVAVTEHRARAEQLIEAQRAVEDVPADQPEGALQVERTHDLASEHRRLEVGRVSVDGLDHEVGHRLAMRVPGLPVGERRRHVLTEQARDVASRRR